MPSEANGTVAQSADAVKPEKKNRRRERGQGGLVKKAGSPFWKILYYDLNGVQHCESSGTRYKSEAQKILTNRLESIRTGNLPLSEIRRLRYEDIKACLVADYRASGKLTEERDGKYTVSGHRDFFKPLDDYFAGMPVIAITSDVLRDFVKQRMDGGVSGPTCNRNLASLRRMFHLAQREGKIQNVPYFPMQKEHAARTGFVERPAFEKLRAVLPENLHPALTFAYETGCRQGTVQRISWDWVDLNRAEIRIPEGIVKNRKPITLPLSSELVSMLKKLFHNGPVFDTTNFRKEFYKAAVAAGLGRKTGTSWYQYSGLIPHDLRRSAVRNLVNSGVGQSVAMRITGHKTVSVFERYNIVTTDQLHDAVAKVATYNDRMKTVAANQNGSEAVKSL